MLLHFLYIAHTYISYIINPAFSHMPLLEYISANLYLVCAMCYLPCGETALNEIGPCPLELVL